MACSDFKNTTDGETYLWEWRKCGVRVPHKEAGFGLA